MGIPSIGSDGTIYVGSWDNNLYAINEYEINISDQSISKGQSLTLQYFPQPSFTYQWFYNAKEIPGATSISYTIENADLEDSGTYVLAIMDQTGKVRLYKPAVITVIPDPVEEKNKEDQLKIEINGNGDRSLTYNPALKDGKANWHIDSSGNLQDWKNIGNLTIIKRLPTLEIPQKSYSRNIQPSMVDLASEPGQPKKEILNLLMRQRDNMKFYHPQNLQIDLI